MIESYVLLELYCFTINGALVIPNIEIKYKKCI